MSKTGVTESRPGPGRPRAEGVDEKILSATLRLLARDGFDAMSIAAVATEAGVSKPTLYRRWGSKEDLVISAVSTLAASVPVDDSGDTWTRLVAELQEFHAAISRPQGVALIGNILALEHRHPHMLELYRRKVASVRRSRFRGVLEEAQAQGEVRADANIEVAINMMVGYYYSARVGGAPVDDGWPQRCVDLVRSGIVAHR